MYDLLSIENLIFPVSPAEFIQEYWEKRSYYKSYTGNPASNYYSIQNLENIASRGTTIKSSGISDSNSYQEKLILSNQITNELDKKNTVCIVGLEKVDNYLRTVLHNFQKTFGLPGVPEVNCYLSDRSSGLPLHFDGRSIMVIQLEGRKKWRYSGKPVVKAPVNNCVVPADRKDVDLNQLKETVRVDVPLTEQTLSAGDVLYLPAGSLHVTEAVGFSISFTISFPSFNYIKLFFDALYRKLLLDQSWRQYLPSKIENTDIETHLKHMLKQLQDETRDLNILELQKQLNSFYH
jgi:ribosomal protein L16 Arg81 hydroxylase